MPARLVNLTTSVTSRPSPGVLKRSISDTLGDPWIRLAIGTGALVMTAMAVRRDDVGPAETRLFRVVNGLPDALYAPAWAVMQMGTLGAAPAAAGTAWLTGDSELAARLLASGACTWALSKLVKRLVRRPRPATLLPGTRCRGRDAAGLGYLSGHAGVAAALGAAALTHLGSAGRTLVLGAVPAVGLTRVYVGAHLPMDIAGGVALGLAVDAAVDLVQASARDFTARTAGNLSEASRNAISASASSARSTALKLTRSGLAFGRRRISCPSHLAVPAVPAGPASTPTDPGTGRLGRIAAAGSPAALSHLHPGQSERPTTPPQPAYR